MSRSIEIVGPIRGRDANVADNTRSAAGLNRFLNNLNANARPKIIAVYNHKGGVAKTTNLWGIAWSLAESGKSVLMVDADAQMNLTHLVCQKHVREHYNGDYTAFWTAEMGNAAPNSDLASAMTNGLTAVNKNEAPGVPTAIKVLKPGAHDANTYGNFPGSGKLLLLAGSNNVNGWDEHLVRADVAITTHLPGMEVAPCLRAINAHGMFYNLARWTAYTHGCDIVLVDLSPSSGRFNRNILLSSSAFLMPMGCDTHSLVTLDFMVRKWPSWIDEHKRLLQCQEAHRTMTGLNFPLPTKVPKFLGLVFMKVQYGQNLPHSQRGAIQSIQQRAQERLAPALYRLGMLLGQGQRQYISDPIPVPQGGNILQTYSTWLPGLQTYQATAGGAQLLQGLVGAPTAGVVPDFGKMAAMAENASAPASFLQRHQLGDWRVGGFALAPNAEALELEGRGQRYKAMYDHMATIIANHPAP